MAQRVVTVFGGSGFIGRHLVGRLAKQGWIVRVAVRRPSQAGFLKPLGEVGQITPLRAPVQDPIAVEAAVAGADAAINLVGILYERGKQTFSGVHARGAQTVAEAATSSTAPILLRTSDDTGHGGGTPLNARIAQAVDVYAFMFDQLGVSYRTPE